MKVAIVDVDDVVIDLVPHWVTEFLRRHPECPDPRSPLWTDWDIAPLVHPDYTDQFWAILDEPALYESAPLVPGAIEGIERLRRMNLRVVFATSATNGHAGVKLRYLVRHRLLDSVVRNENYIELFDKSLLRGDIIIDDRPKTCRKFAAANGGRRSALLFLRPPAIAHEFREGLITAHDWAEVPEKVDWMLKHD